MARYGLPLLCISLLIAGCFGPEAEPEPVTNEAPAIDLLHEGWTYSTQEATFLYTDDHLEVETTGSAVFLPFTVHEPTEFRFDVRYDLERGEAYQSGEQVFSGFALWEEGRSNEWIGIFSMSHNVFATATVDEAGVEFREQIDIPPGIFAGYGKVNGRIWSEETFLMDPGEWNFFWGFTGISTMNVTLAFPEGVSVRPITSNGCQLIDPAAFEGTAYIRTMVGPVVAINAEVAITAPQGLIALFTHNTEASVSDAAIILPDDTKIESTFLQPRPLNLFERSSAGEHTFRFETAAGSTMNGHTVGACTW